MTDNEMIVPSEFTPEQISNLIALPRGESGEARLIEIGGTRVFATTRWEPLVSNNQLTVKAEFEILISKEEYEQLKKERNNAKD